jgi:salicylate hydroxylase
VCADVRERVASMPDWRLWVLHDRAPVASAERWRAAASRCWATPRIPMRPYLAQGAGMAIEDARELQRVLSVADDRTVDVTTALRRYALNPLGARGAGAGALAAQRTIFHATGPLRMARNAAMAVGGTRLLDQPWLYGG